MNNGKTHAGTLPALLGGEERVEDLADYRGGYAGPGVRDAHAQELARIVSRFTVSNERLVSDKKRDPARVQRVTKPEKTSSPSSGLEDDFEEF